MQMAVDLLLVLSIAIIEKVLTSEVIMLFIGVAVLISAIGIIFSLFHLGRRKGK